MKKTAYALTVAAGIVLSSAAFAGARYNAFIYLVKYADGSGSMTGTMAATRNSPDGMSYFGCYYMNTGSFKAVSCYAFDGTKYASCSTSDPALADTASRITGDSYLDIWFDSSARCTSIRLGADSEFAPKAP